MMRYLISLGFLILTIISLVSGHGYLISPPGRASAWRKGFGTPANYDDMGQICRGRCTPCGLPANDAGGKYATNKIVATYKTGETITATAKITANHFGPMYFKLCPNARQVTDACFDQYPLEVVGSSNKYRYDITRGSSGDFDVQLKLPQGVSCGHCVLQWHWDARNTGEKYRNCADISIGGHNGNPDPGRPPKPEGPGQPERPEPPQPPPPPQGGNCRAVSVRASNAWCNANCGRGFCPSDFCTCN